MLSTPEMAMQNLIIFLDAMRLYPTHQLSSHLYICLIRDSRKEDDDQIDYCS